jgi:branched-chain amino acid transport system substrate-binding protein
MLQKELAIRPPLPRSPRPSSSGPAPATAEDDVIVIGSITTLEGPFATGGQDAYRAMEMAFEEIDYTIAESGSSGSANLGRPGRRGAGRARKLIEQDDVDIIIGPLSGAEGIALRDYSRTLEGKTIVNGSSGAADTTLRDPRRTSSGSTPKARSGWPASATTSTTSSTSTTSRWWRPTMPSPMRR